MIMANIFCREMEHWYLQNVPGPTHGNLLDNRPKAQLFSIIGRVGKGLNAPTKIVRLVGGHLLGCAKRPCYNVVPTLQFFKDKIGLFGHLQQEYFN